MEGDDEERRYFAYMSLFVFSMLMLVQAGNFLLMLVGWGLVGLASYLLIGFWHHKPEAVAAAKKAFVMNAIGDATFALGCVLLIWSTGTLEFGRSSIRSTRSRRRRSTSSRSGCSAARVAKSAQIPLHTWLPDAMEGPTPVSALIHAATMVTAGVYLLVRASPIFEAAPDVQHLAAILGAITLLVAGVVALVQWDIKRVIAYSTMSQIGYMFLAAGIGAYGYAIFHLMTHAFFKALLFMTAGLVIHHLDGEQDIRKMGGLKAIMPRTHIAFAVGGLALMGIPIFSGFWSKDGIVSAAFASDDALGYTLYVAGLVGALLTGLYTTRLYFAVFRGEPSEFVKEHAHEGHGEGPRSMTIPVGVLTVLATVGGLVVIPGVWEPFLHWIDETAEPLVQATVARGLRDERDRRLARARRVLRRAPRVRGGPPGRHEPRHLARARAQALLRRGVRRALLPAGRGALGRAPPKRRGAGRRALARRDRRRHAPGRRRGRTRPVRAAAHLRRSPSRSPSPSSSSSSWRCASRC